MQKTLFLLLVAVVLDACAQKSAYEVAVQHYEPVYCYQSIGGVACYQAPYHRDEKRLVNYFGPAPKSYDQPEPPESQKLFAPEPINYWVKDPEPISRPAPHGDLRDRPWLTAEGRAEEKAALRRFRADTETARLAESHTGTNAFLRRIHEALGRVGTEAVSPGSDVVGAAQVKPIAEQETR